MFLDIIRHIGIIHPGFRYLQPLPSRCSGAVLRTVVIRALLVVILRSLCKPALAHNAGGVKAVVLPVYLMPLVHDDLSVALCIVPVIIIRIPGVQAADDKPFLFLHGSVIAHITLVTVIIRYPAFPVVQPVCIEIISPFRCCRILCCPIPDCLISAL